MTTYLLDANVLIALTVTEHEHHERASSWASGITSFALCPMVEGALLRFFLRIGESATASKQILQAVRALPHCTFWNETLSYADIALDHVRGHRQLTDTYLAALAKANGGILATMDEALATDLPDSVTLVPSSPASSVS